MIDAAHVAATNLSPSVIGCLPVINQVLSTEVRLAAMGDYTFYVLEPDGYLVGGTVVGRLDDASAVARATELPGTFRTPRGRQSPRRVEYAA